MATNTESRDREAMLVFIECTHDTILGVPTRTALARVSEDFIIDFARALGLLSVCHVCGTSYCVEAGTPEDVRRATALAYDEVGILDCCGGDTTVF